MMPWIAGVGLAVAVFGVGAALMRQPGARLYDWFATRATRSQPVARPAARKEARKALTQTG